jgi:CBS domain-containing protein
MGHDEEEIAMSATVQDCMTADPVAATPSMTLKQVDELLVEHGITGLPVVDDGELVGVITQSDIIGLLLDEQIEAQRVSDIHQSPFPIPIPALEHLARDSRRIADHMVKTKVRNLMHRDPVTVSVDDSIADAGRAMSARRIHRVFVTDQGRLVGVLSALDIVDAAIDQL